MERMWNGEPLMEPEPPPTPHVVGVPLARCPPQKKPTLELAVAGVNVTVNWMSLSPDVEPMIVYPLTVALATLYAKSRRGPARASPR